MTVNINVTCVDCQKTITAAEDLKKYWDWSNDYNPRQHIVCADCYDKAKAAEQARKARQA